MRYFIKYWVLFFTIKIITIRFFAKQKPASTEEKPPVTTQSNETVNGIEEVEVKEEPQATDSTPSSTESSSQVVSVKTETTEPIETVQESTDSTYQVPLLDPAPTNVVPCDTEPARDSIVESADDTANDTQQEVVVPVDTIDEIAAKVDEIVLEDGTEGGNLCDAIPHNENSAPLHGSYICFYHSKLFWCHTYLRHVFKSLEAPMPSSCMFVT